MLQKTGFIVICILLVTKYIFGQSTTGNIEGWILNEDNQPVSGVNILFTSPDLQGTKGCTTNEFGYFIASTLPVGTYTLDLSHIAYQKLKVKEIQVLLGRTTSLGKIHLVKGTIKTKEVVVTAARQVIDTRSAANSKNLTANQFAELPLERNYFHIAELLPHANTSYKGDRGTNFSGSTGLENRYFIDGSEITDTEIGILSLHLPYNFIREVEIQTGGYQAEYQSALGGVINTITYSGSNEFHGSVFGFFTNNNFSRQPRYYKGQPPQGNYANYDVGFGLGGPLVKDRLWFYAAYDPERISEDVYIKGLDFLNSGITYHKYAGKITWNAGENNLLTLAFSGSPRKGNIVTDFYPTLEAVNKEAVQRDMTEFVMDASVRGIHKLSEYFMLESSLSLYSDELRMSSVSPRGNEPVFEDYVNGTLSGGQGFSYWEMTNRLLKSSIKGTLLLPAHTIKAGAGYYGSSIKQGIDWRDIVRYPENYYYFKQIQKGTLKSNIFSAFIQDSWQISDRLCFNAGLRWDPQWLIGSDGSLAQKITDQVQPRIGVVYQPGEPGIQKITASYGRFYEPLLLSMSVTYHITDGYWGAVIYPNDPRIDTSNAQALGNFAGYVTNIPDLKGQYNDEITIGYERLISNDFKIGVRGIYRWLGQGIEDGVVSEADQERYGSLQVYGNPGSGSLSMLPRMKREYTALELTLQRFDPTGINFLFSYVLSRNWGNYDGLAETYDQSGSAILYPNNTDQFGTPERLINSEGLLPNDRTHVFKFFGSYRFDFGLTTGMALQLMSGTPLNEFGADQIFGASTFLQPRGTVGRTPFIWDLNLRFMYDVSNIFPLGYNSKLILDILHVASQRTIIDYYQYHYFDYEQNYADPSYMKPVQFQPPMSLRIGMEVNF